MSKIEQSDAWNLPQQIGRVLLVGGLTVGVTFSVVGLAWLSNLTRGRVVIADLFFVTILMPLLALIPIGSTVLLSAANRFPREISVRALAAAALCWPFLPLAAIGWRATLWLAMESLILGGLTFAIILFYRDVIDEWLDNWLKSFDPEPESASSQKESTPPPPPTPVEAPPPEPEPPATMPLSDFGEQTVGDGWLRWNDDDVTGNRRYEGGDAVVFSPGQKRAVWHIAFQRPFNFPPQFDLEITQGDEVRWQIGGVFSYGVRVEFRRSVNVETELRVPFEFAAFLDSNDANRTAA